MNSPRGKDGAKRRSYDGPWKMTESYLAENINFGTKNLV
jgi:hypothetical protein